MDDEKTVDLAEGRLAAQPKGRAAVVTAGESACLTPPLASNYAQTDEQAGDGKATTTNVLVEAFKDTRQSFFEILKDVYETVAVLLSLQFVHIVVGALSLPDEVKNVINIIHTGGSLLVITLLTLGFAKRVAKRTLGIDINLSGKKSQREKTQAARDSDE
jgi:hypothetical protein